MEMRLDGKQIGVLVANGVNASKFSMLLHEIRNAGGTPWVIGLTSDEVHSWNPSGWGEQVHVDAELSEVQADQLDGLVVPGGQMSADALRGNHEAVDLMRRIIETGKPGVLIGHAVWLLAETELCGGMAITGAPTIRTDFKYTGARWCDSEVEVESGIVTVRSTDLLEQAMPKIIEELAEGRHDRPGITDVVAEASEDSFPASDPPAWTPGRVARREG